MEYYLRELCVVAQTILQAQNVALALCDYSKKQIEIIASSNSADRHLDWKYKFTFSEPRMYIRDITKLKQFENHPIHERYPNLKTCVYHHLGEVDSKQLIFCAWNPSKLFFDNVFSQTALDGLISLIAKIVSEKNTIHITGFVPIAQVTGMSENDLPKDQEPASEFLSLTLVSKQRLLLRNGIPYIGLRTSRKDIKEHQIVALKALKISPPRKLVEKIALEFKEAVDRLYGQMFDCVIPIPCGSSGKTDCLSVELGKILAQMLKVRFENVLKTNTIPGKSHPKKSAKLMPYELIRPIKGKILLIDDVVTSGRHLELAANSLKPQADFLMSMAWIVN